MLNKFLKKNRLQDRVNEKCYQDSDEEKGNINQYWPGKKASHKFVDLSLTMTYLLFWVEAPKDMFGNNK